MKGLIPIFLLLAGVGCQGPTTIYDWGGYDQKLYNLMEHPDALQGYGLSLKKQIDRNPDGTRIPPGIFAEYGYVLYATNKKAEAAEYFIREKIRWPQSSKLMDRMVKACAPPQEVQAESAPANRFTPLPPSTPIPPPVPAAPEAP